MKLNLEILKSKPFIIGLFLALGMYFIPVETGNPLIVIMYGIIVIIPLSLIIIEDFYKYSKTIRTALIGFTFGSLLLGIIPFLLITWNLTFYITGNFFGIFRTVFLSGLTATIERMIWWYEQQPLKQNESINELELGKPDNQALLMVIQMSDSRVNGSVTAMIAIGFGSFGILGLYDRIIDLNSWLILSGVYLFLGVLGSYFYIRAVYYSTVANRLGWKIGTTGGTDQVFKIIDNEIENATNLDNPFQKWSIKVIHQRSWIPIIVGVAWFALWIVIAPSILQKILNANV